MENCESCGNEAGMEFCEGTVCEICWRRRAGTLLLSACERWPVLIGHEDRVQEYVDLAVEDPPNYAEDICEGFAAYCAEH